MSNVAARSRTVLSLCAGYGGLDLGLRVADPAFSTACFVEREITAARILVSRIADGSLDDAPIWSDLTTFRGKPWRGRIHTITAGYPCQPFSCAGKRLGKKDPRHLWPHVARIIREVQPRQVFLENVDAHLRLGFHEVAEQLERMGYRVACGLFSAEEVGAPHRRLRLFALAERKAGRRGELRESPGGTGFIDGCRADVAHCDVEQRLWQPGRKAESVDRQGASDYDCRAGGTVAHPRGALQQTRARVRGNGQPLPSARSGNGSGSVAESSRERHPQRSNRQNQEEKLAASVRSGLPIFPPGPGDLEAWTRLLMLSPDVEPALCRDASRFTARLDEPGSRVQRLRALGNGVVPQTACLAYLTLRADLDESRSVSAK